MPGSKPFDRRGHAVSISVGSRSFTATGRARPRSPTNSSNGCTGQMCDGALHRPIYVALTRPSTTCSTSGVPDTNGCCRGCSPPAGFGQNNDRNAPGPASRTRPKNFNVSKPVPKPISAHPGFPTPIPVSRSAVRRRRAHSRPSFPYPVFSPAPSIRSCSPFRPPLFPPALPLPSRQPASAVVIRQVTGSEPANARRLQREPARAVSVGVVRRPPPRFRMGRNLHGAIYRHADSGRRGCGRHRVCMAGDQRGGFAVLEAGQEGDGLARFAGMGDRLEGHLHPRLDEAAGQVLALIHVGLSAHRPRRASPAHAAWGS